MKKHIVETTSKVIFMFLLGVVVILISLGIKQDFSRIKTSAFWTETGAQLFVTMVIFNIVYSIDLGNRMHDKKSRFFRAYATNTLRRKEIDKNKLGDKLEEAVGLKNKEILIKKCNNLLHRICTRVYYEDVVTEEPVEDIISRCKVNKKREKKFIKLVNKIREGRIKITPIKADIFLQDKESIFEKEDVYDYSNFVYESKRNLIKMGVFLGSTVLMATITFSFVSVNFWSAFLTNFTLFIGATVSGFTSASKSIKLKTAIYEKRNQFLHKYLDLSLEYTEE